MKKNKIFLLLIVMLSTFGACYNYYEQNKIVLRLSPLGSADARQGTNINANKDSSSVIENDEFAGYGAEMYTAAKVSTFGDVKVRYYVFNRGIESYTFTGQKSPKNVGNEAIFSSSEDANFTYDIVLQAKVLDTLSHDELKNRLLRLIATQGLSKYSGTDNVLGSFAGDRLKMTLKSICQRYTSKRKTLDVIHGKKEFNEFIRTELNKMFEPLGVTFILAGVASYVTLPEELQKKMNEVAAQQIQYDILQYRTIKINPIDSMIVLKQSEINLAQEKIVAEYEQKASIIRSNADTERREKLIGVLGAKQFMSIQTMKEFVEAAKQSDQIIELLPKGSSIIPMGPQSNK